jgi:hypothetical protein
VNPKPLIYHDFFALEQTDLLFLNFAALNAKSPGRLVGGTGSAQKPLPLQIARPGQRRVEAFDQRMMRRAAGMGGDCEQALPGSASDGAFAPTPAIRGIRRRRGFDPLPTFAPEFYTV